MRFVKPPKWCLVMIDILEEDKLRLEEYVKVISDRLKVAKPEIIYKPIDKQVTLNIEDVTYAEGEFSELISDKIFDKFDTPNKRKNISINNTAVLFCRSAFKSTQLFEKMTAYYEFKDDGYHLICTSGDFLDISGREHCVNFSCSSLCKLCDDKCKHHSCLLRLLYLMFDKDPRVIEIAKAFKV